MNAPTPFALVGHTIEKTHLVFAGVQYLDWYRLPLPYDHWVQAAALVPLLTFGIRDVWPLGCKLLGELFALASEGLFIAAKLPNIIGATANKTRKWFGGLLQISATYLMS